MFKILLSGYTLTFSERSTIAAHSSGVHQTFINALLNGAYRIHTTPPKQGRRVPAYLRSLLEQTAGRFARGYFPALTPANPRGHCGRSGLAGSTARPRPRVESADRSAPARRSRAEKAHRR